ncbi:MAG TPA: protein-glutamate O-methyltransferase CheR, partial [Tepidisphaeraceae bacterium]|nr:protein-glutamate O-methyltransferase CheR [Tepidisphaeraceae bacterium]
AASFAFRHVVFPDGADDPRVAVNMAPLSARCAGDPSNDLTRGEYECVQWLFARAGLDVDQYRPETVKRRLPACTRALRLQCIEDVCTAVRRKPELLALAINALVIGVTCFFRDPTVFAAIDDTVLPEILRLTSAPRVWSVACSDGAELYSIAMLLASKGVLPRANLVGTDCRTEGLDRARAGNYETAAVKHVPPELVERYMSFDGTRWQVAPVLRTGIHWRLRNALAEPEPGPWDLILCRNVAIYLQPQAVGRLWGRLASALRPGGFLVLGKAERPYGATRLRPVGPCVYQREWS